MKPRSIVVVSDFAEGWPPAATRVPVAERAAHWADGSRGPAPGRFVGADAPLPPVLGGYLERLPLAAIRAGLVDHAEIWHHWRPDAPAPPVDATNPHLVRRAFHADPGGAPFASSDMLGFIETFGAPDILCVYGLGVDEAVMEACASSVRIYNSIDAPSLRVPAAVSRHFDIVLTAADWQTEEVLALHPGMLAETMPVGPEFASAETFFPIEGAEKPYDVIYVAAAQAYKRHDLLLAALARHTRRLRALCVIGYGELAESLRDEAERLGLDIDFVGPPGVSHAEVNRLMNSARIGIVCGVDDGAPAILTEYMLAGLPVLANSALRCGLQYITAQTGLAVPAATFGEAIDALLANRHALDPRRAVLERWTWPYTIEKLGKLVDCARHGRSGRLWREQEEMQRIRMSAK